jgi:hypothetical protein
MTVPVKQCKPAQKDVNILVHIAISFAGETALPRCNSRFDRSGHPDGDAPSLRRRFWSRARASPKYVNPTAYPQTGDPADVQVVIEIPAFTKYELDGETVIDDLVESMPVVNRLI